MSHSRHQLTPAHVERELGFASRALERSDYVAALDHLTTARDHLNRVPTLGASEYAFVAFAAADEHLDAARETVERDRTGGHGVLSDALLSLRSANAQVQDDRTAA